MYCWGEYWHVSFCSLGLRVKLECPVFLMYRRHLLRPSCSLLRHKEVTQDSPSSSLKSHFMNISPWKVTCGPEPWTALWDSTGLGLQPRAWLVLYVACVRCCTGSICLPSGLAGGSPITNDLSSTTLQYGWSSCCDFMVLPLSGGWWNAKLLTQDDSQSLPCWTLGICGRPCYSHKESVAAGAPNNSD